MWLLLLQPLPQRLQWLLPRRLQRRHVHCARVWTLWYQWSHGQNTTSQRSRSVWPKWDVNMSSYVCHICGRVCRAKIGLISHLSTQLISFWPNSHHHLWWTATAATTTVVCVCLRREVETVDWSGESPVSASWLHWKTDVVWSHREDLLTCRDASSDCDPATTTAKRSYYTTPQLTFTVAAAFIFHIYLYSCRAHYNKTEKIKFIFF